MMVLDNPNTTYEPPIKRYVQEIVATKGDLGRAAENLGCSLEEIALALVDDVKTLQKVTRAVQLIQLFDMTNMTSRMLLARMAELRPDDLSKTYLGGVALIEKLTNDKPNSSLFTQNNLTIEQSVLDALPPEVRMAVVTVLGDEDAA